MTLQQDQALAYFSGFAADWRKKASGGYPHKFNVIAARNAYAHSLAKAMPTPPRTLDIGCGSGELVVALREQGIPADGVDFAPDMIDLCKKLAQEKNVQARFDCASFFAYDVPPASYDFACAIGFIEYISPEECLDFLKKSHSLLKPGGIITVSSRNRLFNIPSLNDYTRLEISLKTTDALLEESIGLASGKTMNDAIAWLRKTPRKHPNPAEHPHHEVKVSTRYQFTPGELVTMFEAHGFETTDLYPVHMHGVPPVFKDAHPQVHYQIANILQDMAAPALLPTASALMITARKR